MGLDASDLREVADHLGGNLGVVDHNHQGLVLDSRQVVAVPGPGENRGEALHREEVDGVRPVEDLAWALAPVQGDGPVAALALEAGRLVEGQVAAEEEVRIQEADRRDQDL